MSISGIFLVLFLTFHAAMNVAAIFSEDAYNLICALLGANWYAVAATVALAGIIAIHFIYALLLTLQNRKARGSDRYAVNVRQEKVAWASKNMFVLGIIVVGFMLLHFAQFWYKMMFAELMGSHEVELGAASISPQDGAAFINYYFSQLWVVIAYLVWYAALWFHLTHGIWSGIQTIGWSNNLWIKRWKVIGNIYATLLMLAFAFVTVFFYAKNLL
jgi:succinate dehydrogenase / fumarate reductase cytochrome b subunit